MSVLFLVVNTFALEGSSERKLIGGTMGKTNESRKSLTKIALASLLSLLNVCSVEGALVVACKTDFRCVYHMYSLILFFSFI